MVPKLPQPTLQLCPFNPYTVKNKVRLAFIMEAVDLDHVQTLLIKCLVFVNPALSILVYNEYVRRHPIRISNSHLLYGAWFAHKL